jgi:hypothetical protein
MIGFITVVSTLFLGFMPLMVVDAQEVTDSSTSQVIIISPEPGQALQGTVLIIGQVDTNDAIKLEMSFSYTDNPRDTWFLIHEIDEAIPGEFNLEWDTNLLTDGQYSLRAVVTTSEGQFISIVPGLRVRNYSIIETSTPQPPATRAPEDSQAPVVTSTMTITPIPNTATPLPPNPAQITTRDISLSIAKGAAAVFGLFAVLGLYQYARNRRTNSDR